MDLLFYKMTSVMTSVFWKMITSFSLTEFLTGVDILDRDAIEQVRGLVRDYIESLSKVNDQQNIGPEETQVYDKNLNVYKI
jgi:hypothetical protein